MKEEEWYNDDDPDSDSPRTELVKGSRRSEDLYDEILEDPSHQRFDQLPRSQEMLLFSVGVFILLNAIILIAAALGLLNVEVMVQYVFVGSAVMGVFILCSYAYLILEQHYNGLFVSNKGVAWKSFKFGNEAIEWEHVTHIGIILKNDEISGMNIYGNRRKILYQNPIWEPKVTFEILRNYIPDIHEWKVSHDKGRFHQYVRYRRMKQPN